MVNNDANNGWFSNGQTKILFRNYWKTMPKNRGLSEEPDSMGSDLRQYSTEALKAMK